MKDEEIQEAIAGGVDAVKALVQAISDRRVNEAVETARKKWEANLPDKVAQEVERRETEAKEKAARRVAVADELREKFGNGVKEETWTEFIDVDGLATLEGDERTAAIEKETERVRRVVDGLLKERFNNGPEMEGTAETSTGGLKEALLEKMRI